MDKSVIKPMMDPMVLQTNLDDEELCIYDLYTEYEMV
jgi:hypothetical protein